MLDVVADPLEGKYDVEHARVARRGVLLAGDVAQMQVAEDVEPVIDCHHNDIATVAIVDTVVRARGAGTRGESAAVQPDHDGAFAAVVYSGCPHVQHEAVLALATTGNGDTGALARSEEAADQAAAAGIVFAPAPLGRHGAKFERVAHAGPSRRGFRRHESLRAAGGGAVGYAEKDIDALLDGAAHVARRGFDDRSQIFGRECPPPGPWRSAQGGVSHGARRGGLGGVH